MKEHAASGNLPLAITAMWIAIPKIFFSMRRWVEPSTSHSGPLLPRPEESTNQRFTGTWSVICAKAARSVSMASFSVKTANFAFKRGFPSKGEHILVAATQEAIEGLLRVNQATAKLLRDLAAMARPGITTDELNDYAMDYMTQLGATPVFYTEEGFPGCINTSVNDAAVHGVPGKQRLKIGDVLSIDAGMLLDGYAGDSTITIAVGKVSAKHQHLIETARKAMLAGIQAARSGKRIGDIGYAIQSVAWSEGFDVLREYIGHGLGHVMHESPDVPNTGRL